MNTVTELLQPVENDLDDLILELKNLIGAGHPILQAAAEHLFSAGGKRLRPGIVLLISKAISPEFSLKSKHKRLAEITEMIHTASLVHDDVVDEASTRRGVDTVHSRFNTRVAVLAGDFLFAQASWHLANLDNVKVVKLLSRVIMDLAEGEIKQNLNRFDSAQSFSKYINKSYCKTASLIANSCKAAGVLSDLNDEKKKEPPTFLYAMDMGDGKYFLEETSLGLVNPLTMENLKERLEKRLSYRNISITSMQHEELGLFLPMNMPIPDFKQQILGYGGAASMVHPASGYLIGNVLRRAPLVAKAVSEAIKNKNLSTYHIARKGWETLWSKELIRKKSLYQFGLEKLMRFDEKLLREFFGSFFQLPKNQWYGFLTDTLSLKEIVYAMCVMFIKAPWSVKKGLMIMHGREFKMLLRIIFPNI